VAILGGGMAGVSAAWRLSEPGWRDRFESITVYQRGWRLGGKGASSRGVNGRIEEHGLHVWLGHYDNAFRVMRDCYAELARDWREAFIPASDIGIFDLHDGVWRPWIGHFAETDRLPGDADDSSTDPIGAARRTARLLRDLVESFDELDPVPHMATSAGATSARPMSRAAAAALTAGIMVEAWALAAGPLAARAGDEVVGALDTALTEMRAVLEATTANTWGARQTWQVIGLVAALLRGVIADEVLSDPVRLRGLNDEDFMDWLRRHGASPSMVDSTYVRGLFDLAFAHAGGDPDTHGFGAGLGIILSIKTMLDYKGAFFWKMTAGMGDVVFAPLYEALRARGVDFAFFHRVDALHISADGASIDGVTMGCQAEARDYQPLVTVNGLACFPDRPKLDGAIADEPLEAAWCTWPDAHTRTLRRGADFDEIVFAIPPPMAGHVCGELIAARPEWRDMVANIATVATQSLQLWLRKSDEDLGWPLPGATMTGYVDGFDTWASMPQLLATEGNDDIKSIAYFCNTLDGEWPPLGDWQEHAAREHERVRVTAQRFCEEDLGPLLPHFQWDVLDSQYWRANVDPSDRYVQSLPGTDKYRLRPDESGFDNMVLAGDWTDSGINAGCVEAAVVSGLQAANALLGRHRLHRILGTWLV
jgi:uncharacterized protein with NAD-binding domain and iron-sulfur cluster